jgi:hypothetical protein
MGDVTDAELAQLRQLVGSSIYHRQENVHKYPVLLKVYPYKEEAGVYYEDYSMCTDAFPSVRESDVADQMCYHIIWDAWG